MHKFSEASLNHREGVDYRLVEISDMALNISAVDFGIPSSGGVRTAEEQNRLFHNDLSKCDGYNILSEHQSGKALDVYAYVNGASWDEAHLTTVAAAMLQAASILGCKLKWGGHWARFKDMAHFELED